MPAIPLYEQRLDATGPIPELAVPSKTGPALQMLGDFLEKDAINKAGSAVAKFREDWAARYEDSKSKAAIDGENFTPTALSDFDQLAFEHSKDIQNPTARMFFKAATKEYRPHVDSQARIWEATTRAAWREQSSIDNADRMAVAIESDPDSRDSAIAQQLAVLETQGLHPEQRLKLSRYIVNSAKEAAKRGMANRDPRGTLEQLQNPGAGPDPFDGLTLAQRDRIETYASQRLVEQRTSAVMAAHESGGPTAGARAEREALADAPPALADNIRANVSAQVGQLRNQRREESVEDLTQLERSIATNTAGAQAHHSVDSLYQRGALTPLEVANYHAAIDRSTLQRARDNAGMQEIAAALSQGLPLDPRSSQQREALDSAFRTETIAAPVGSPAWQATALAYAGKARMLPDSSLAWTRQALRSPDPQIAAGAAQFYGAVAAAAPDAVSGFDQDTKAFAATLSGMIESGTPAAKALETARAIAFDVKPELVEQRKVAYRKQVAGNASALSSYIDRDFDPSIFSAQPAASVGLSTDFDSQVSRYYSKVGDIKLARDLAWQDLKHIYGPSRVNGDPMMIMFPPERFGVTPAEIRTELGDFLKGNPQADGSTAADIIVVPDGQTQRFVTSGLNGQPVQPSYKLVTKTGDLVLDSHGIPKRYALPNGEELAKRIKAAQDAAEAEAHRLVDEARAERARRDQAAHDLAEQARRGQLPRGHD